MKKSLYITLAFLAFCIHFGYANDSLTAQTDSSNTKSVVIITETPDSITTTTDYGFKPSPKRAMLYSAIIPGSGQIYNKKYWKAPLIWGGFAAIIYAISWNGDYYQEYRKAYTSIADENESTTYYEKYIPEGTELTDSYLDWLESALLSKQQYYRRYRDLSIIGIIALYGANILDAYVDAQLFDYDISPDLTVRIEPTIGSSLANNESSFGLRCQLNF